MIMTRNDDKIIKQVQVIGMGLSPQDLTLAHLDIINQADVLVGGKRHLESFEHVQAEKREITSPISAVLDFIQESMKKPKGGGAGFGRSPVFWYWQNPG